MSVLLRCSFLLERPENGHERALGEETPARTLVLSQDAAVRCYPTMEVTVLHLMIIRSGILVLAALRGTSAVANAEVVKFKANMDASQEVPSNDSKGKGTAELTYDTTSKELTWTITFDGLSGAATAAHFHGPAEPGKNAGVAVPIGQTGQTVTSPASGKATLTDAQAADLMAGRWYVNIHTAANKGGEIRGQVTK